MAGAQTPVARYRLAYNAGHAGRALPAGLADLADSDPKIDSAYQAGQGDENFDSWSADNGVAPNPPSGRRQRAGRQSSSSRSRGSGSRRSAPSPIGPSIPRYGGRGVGQGASLAGGDAAGVLLGLVGAALLLSLLDYGPKGPLLWLKAKFLNQPAGAPAAGSSNAPPASPPRPSPPKTTTKSNIPPIVGQLLDPGGLVP